MRRQAGTMQQQIADGDFRAPRWIRIGCRCLIPFREITRNRQSDINAMFLREKHDRRSGDDRLGQRGDIVDRVGSHGWRILFVRHAAERMHGEVIAMADRENASRKRAIRDAAIENFVGLFQP